MPEPDPNACLLCGQKVLSALPLRLEKGVTSDGRPWPFVGEFLACNACGFVQKRLDSIWLEQVAHIYDTYEMYALSNGSEPLLFEGGGNSVPRTTRLLDNALKNVALPPRGRLLDVGCGNGALLRTFGHRQPGWELAGCDQQEDRRQAVMAVPGVREFYCQPLEEVPEIFDMITLLYVIEHLFFPVRTLRSIRTKLSPGGLLFVHTSDLRENPFDLPVVDHCAHFTLETLTAMVRTAGFEVLAASNAWNSKEIGVLARVATHPDMPVSGPFIQPRQVVTAHLAWLNAVRAQADAAAETTPFGIYGTSNAAVWLAASMRGKVSFFLDDDRTKQGKHCLERPILDVAAAPPDAAVYMAFPPEMARRVAARASAKRPGLRCLVPPNFAPTK
jgi:2-polyprenyl-3-methyl-5-hydroxy-6-metoxy-1,4-benzoquinol methylase